MMLVLSVMGWESFAKEAGGYLLPQTARQETVVVVNRFLVRMRRIGDCGSFEEMLPSTLELFAPGAHISSTSKNRSWVDSLPAEKYLRKINGFKCGRPQKYRFMTFQYNPVDESMATIIGTGRNNSYLVRVDVEQRFVGGDSETSILYDDDTLKRFFLEVYTDQYGYIVCKILRIEAEPPTS